MQRIIIIGAGFGGLCMGIGLRRAGIDSFILLEKAASLGGTWRDNTYPGAACDVPSFQYCFSFEQKTDWSRRWAPQAEILDYMEHCADKYGLRPHLRFGAEVQAARFDGEAELWEVTLAGGETLQCEILISAVGQLHRPFIPEILGQDNFTGEQFHSARWNHTCDLRDRDVAVIGNAASAVQLVPEVAKLARRLSVFQRSANWLLPRGERPYPPLARWAFAHVPLAARLHRLWIFLRYEMLWPVIRGKRPGIVRRVERMFRAYLKRQIRDPALREKLVPDYPLGGKRLLISDDYFAALDRDDVALVTDPIDRFTTDAIVTRDGSRHPADCVIYATGFRTTEFLQPMEVTGEDGQRLQDQWQHGARAYLGITVSGFPNFFMLYGPNTNLGHNSILFMLECQCRYVLRCIRELDRRGARTLDVKPAAMEDFDARVQRELSKTVWARTDGSWYRDASGRITNNWSGSTLRYWWMTRRPRFRDYRFS
ncbi:MAG: NAD(P)/FAD-dependent oxidoreductase [Myxococcales bacterium]